MKIVRRIIIVVALILLLPNIFSMITSFKSDIPKEIREQVKSGNARMIKLNKEVSLEQDKIIFKQLIVSDKETLLIYEVHRKEPGWSFPNGALKLMDEKGNAVTSDGGSSSGESWGELIINHYEQLPKDMDTVVVDFQWYDRSFQTEISLEQEER